MLVPALLTLVWALVVATAIDLEHRIIPNRLTLRLPLVLLPLLAIAALLEGEWWALGRGVLAGLAVPGVLLLISEAFRLVRGKRGVGMGDIKLLVSIGLVVGYLGGWHLVVFAYATIIAAAIIVAALMLARRANLATRIPFGPYLALGALIAILGGDATANLAQRLLGL